MEKYIFLLAFGLTSCISYRSKKHYKFTNHLCENASNKCSCNLFREAFSVFDQGAFGTGMISDYVTDSVTFRIYIGTYDEENEMIVVTCNGGDSLYVETRVFLHPGVRGSPFKTKEKTNYSIEDLKKRHVFD